MLDTDVSRLKAIKTFEHLIEYLRDELDWPIEAEDAEDITFDYDPEDLGIEEKHVAKVKSIKQVRPLTDNQPWGIFYIEFESKRLPVVVLRRILRGLVPKKRASAQGSERAVWNLHDLLFISAMGEEGYRRISFAHFRENGEGIPQLQTFSWDERETHFYYLDRDIKQLRWPDDERDVDAWKKQWASALRTPHRYVIRTSIELSQELAKIASRTRDIVQEVYGIESEDGPLHNLYESFKKVLIHDLDVKRFADMVAQSIAYGLFSARATGEELMGLAHLEDMVPNTNTFLRELFAEFSKVSGHKRDQIDFEELGVSELVDMLNTADMGSVLEDFGRQTGGGKEDPVVNFYELFLKEYDKKQKVKRGVFYTPKPVVSFIVRSVDEILKKNFGLEDGLADTTTWGEMAERNKHIKVPNGVSPHSPFVQILDPAVGTGTFLETAIEVIHDTMSSKWTKQGKKKTEIDEEWNDYVPMHLLPRLYGFELMMAPYAVAHMKLGLKLKETGYKFKSAARLRVYLTNTLEEAEEFFGEVPEFLAHEAQEANRAKRGAPATVVIGNPPYSVISQNEILWIKNKIRKRYYPNDEIKELNPKPLLDDYVKFILYSQLVLERTGCGILGMITNNGYLDAPLFRKMRAELMRAFGNIYALNLHGNVNKKEVCPDGSPDENVFGIKQVGTAIGLSIRNGEQTKERSLSYSDLWGTNEKKCAFLGDSIFVDIEWRLLSPMPLFYLFTPQTKNFLLEYNEYWKITTVMPFNNTGLITSRDAFVVGFTPEEILSRIEDFAQSPLKEARDKYGLRDVRERSLKESHEMIKAMKDRASKIITCLYRPFDFRPVFYHHSLVRWPVYEVMEHMLVGENMGLVANRQVTSLNYCHTNVSRYPIEYKSGSHDRNTQLFPLYIYFIGQQDSHHGKIDGCMVNLAPKFVEEFASQLNLAFISDGQGDLSKTFGPEDVFYYIYAVLHSPTYRTRYAELLKIDFPRVPLTNEPSLFRSLCSLGTELVSLHLMESPKLNNHITIFYDKSDRRIAKVGETGKNLAQERNGKGRLYINSTSYFDGVLLDVWNFRIGGYQVCYKWLKDRKGRNLSNEEIDHYQKIIVALNETLRLMDEIDEAIEEHGGWPDAFVTKEGINSH